MIRLLPLAAFFLSAPAAAETPQDAHWAPAAYFDVLAPGNQIAHLRDATRAVCDPLQKSGVGCQTGFSASASVGARAGMYYETEDYRYGASLGVLTGGPDQGHWSVAASGTGAGVTERTTSTVFPLLGEMSQKFLISDDWYGDIGAGMGLAMSNQTSKCYATGSLGAVGGACYARGGGTWNLGWFAWEIFPSIQYQDFEFGLRYFGMARGGRYLPWNTIGFSTGWHFL